ncbi:hypothetical protein EV702DRAFT_1050682 [Suillus placidus]|uniref:Uncharacterized protein n=1 Tax=Suillus placidus TaxID=48579 RepID=A0A9P7CWW0_9AGAM|nr:hypothetical protein EV702DRAFT_1050682 [Suillus placidus]
MWKQGVEKWEADMSATNPFSPTTATITQASEWCKARARANRWTEEVQFHWRRCGVSENSFRGMLHGGMSRQGEERVGIKGYAKRQACLRRKLQIAFNDMWGMIESSTTAEAQL